MRYYEKDVFPEKSIKSFVSRQMQYVNLFGLQASLKESELSIVFFWKDSADLSGNTKYSLDMSSF